MAHSGQIVSIHIDDLVTTTKAIFLGWTTTIDSVTMVLWLICISSLAWHKTVVSLMLMQWRYHSLPQSHQYDIHHEVGLILFTFLSFHESYGTDTVMLSDMRMFSGQFMVDSLWPSDTIWQHRSGPRLNIKTVLSTYGDFHVKDKTAVRTSYL